MYTAGCFTGEGLSMTGESGRAIRGAGGLFLLPFKEASCEPMGVFGRVDVGIETISVVLANV